MLRRLTLLLVALLALPCLARPPVQVAIIIDDLGNHRELGRRAVDLPADLTYSILPQLPYSRYLSRRAFAAGKEVMLHQPMQAERHGGTGPGVLRIEMGREEIVQVVNRNLATVPHAAGVNNHMGSLLTREPLAMRWLMEDLSCRSGDLYFVDSRTDIRTVARDMARAAGLATAQRDVFLDNRPEQDYIRRQLRRLVSTARRRGSAIGIGHPYPQTLAVLAEELPALRRQGVEIVPVSRLVEQRKQQLWHACLSPLPTVAKSSRP